MSDIDQLEALMLREFGKVHRKLDKAIEACERIATRQLATDARVANHSGRLRAVELREEQRSIAEPGPDWRAESTGTYDVRRLVEEARERKSDAKHLRRKSREWIVSAIGAVLLVLLTAAVSTAVARSAGQPAQQTR